MRTLRLSPSPVAALLLAGALALAGCPDDPEPPPPPPCELAQLGDACAAGTECCSGNCQNEICVLPVPECRAVHTSCAHPFDCCFGACDSLTCRDPNEPGCVAQFVGDPCDEPTDCCTTGSCGGPIGAQICRPPDGQCLPLGEPCTETKYCCNSAICDPTTSRCVEPVQPPCRETGTCTADSQCCSGACDAGTCVPSAGVCGWPGEQCATSSDCCSQNCPGAGTPGASCSPDICRKATEPCLYDWQCCSWTCGSGDVCEPLPPGSTAQTCKTLGEACALPGDCCSTNCRGGTCKPAASCNAFGDVCVRPEDCCSGLCAQGAAGQPGRCDDASGGCGLDGYPCTADSNCCTKKCVDLGTGAKVCQPSAGCRMTGNYCDSTASCCGGTNSTDTSLPNEYGVFCDGPGTHPGAPEWDTRTQDDRTCTGGQSCNPPGNICGYKATQNCCHTGTGSGSQVCRFDSNGIQRCFGGRVDPPECVETPGAPCCPLGWNGNDPDCCIQVGNVCQMRDQCCGLAPCVPDSAGVLRCGGTCLPQGATCSAGGTPSCCEGTTCQNIPELGWACARAGGDCALKGEACGGSNPDCCFGPCVGGVCDPDCANLGGSCSTDAQCCGGMCDGTRCVACMPEAGACTDTADCCSGLTCEIPAGTTRGTCTSGGTWCAGTGLSCATDPCCNPADTCTAGICEPPAPPCSENDQQCTFGGNECCAPLGCYTVDAFEQRVDCGPGSVSCFCDQVTACQPMDAACSTLVTCCGGFCAQNGSTAACTSTDPTQCACKPAG